MKGDALKVLDKNNPPININDEQYQQLLTTDIMTVGMLSPPNQDYLQYEKMQTPLHHNNRRLKAMKPQSSHKPMSVMSTDDKLVLLQSTGMAGSSKVNRNININDDLSISGLTGYSKNSDNMMQEMDI